MCFATPGHPDQWAERLKRVFNIDIETCNNCAGNAKIIACIEDPLVIEKILTYLGRNRHWRAFASVSGAAAGQLARLMHSQPCDPRGCGTDRAARWLSWRRLE